MRSWRKLFALLLAAVAVAFGLPAHAQTTDGTISGVVRDASGAGVPGATLTITNQATKAAQTATSGADGSYSVSLAPGMYSVAITLKGLASRRSVT